MENRFLKYLSFFSGKIKKELTGFLKKDDAGGVVEWLIVLIACAVLCSIIYTNITPGLKHSSQRMGNALMDNN